MEPQTNFETQNLEPNIPSNLPPKNSYKTLFFLSSGLFLVIISVLVTLLITQKSSKPTQTTPTDTEETELTPTETTKTDVESITSVPTENAITPTKSATTKDSRTLISPSKDGFYHTDIIDFPSIGKECLEDFILDDTNITTIPYVDKNHGISFNIPYSSLWGTKKYRLNQYDTIDSTTITFGKLTMAIPNCNGQRIFSLEILPTATEAEISKRNGDNYSKPEMIKINNLNIATYNDDYGSGSRYEILGKTHNYRFFGLGFQKEVENIIKTVKLL